MRRIPILPSVLVLVAVAIMVSLGVWQLHRLDEKEALLAHFAAARVNPAPVAWSAAGVSNDLLYRRATLTCAKVTARSSMAGRNASDQPGVAQTAQCLIDGGGKALVVLGWSVNPLTKVDWNGGVVTGTIAPGPRLVADPPLGGLAANALPDPSEIPNNHFSYAIQWFLFAITAVVIYVIALRKRR
ncbi:SURF1 family protein [Novosphingobium sp. Leaf2]|uniref:SURF1 family protein n=1 Tax=Novosphingobium sp. Leaf2 TaxID=1735670 RepID=UPI0006F5C3FD|nr:SURF1 family protein [Novosphingobium sp. Leaf2]KQM18451.1 threonine synthase [Novosphingobium sp. Leaf2]